MSQPRDDKGRFAPKAGGLVLAIVIGTSVAVGIGTGAGGAGAGAATRSTDAPTPSVQQRSARGKQRAGRVQRGLATRGLKATLKAERDSTSCTADAYGQVREFLATHQCESIYRSLLEVRNDGVAVLVAVAWVDMTRLDDATQLKEIVDRPGAGNFTQLPPPGHGQAVNINDAAYASRQNGTVITIVEAEPEAVTAFQRLLKDVAEHTADDAKRLGLSDDRCNWR
jgi:hypothetical protein